jgi:hypothetical protein
VIGKALPRAVTAVCDRRSRRYLTCFSAVIDRRYSYAGADVTCSG